MCSCNHWWVGTSSICCATRLLMRSWSLVITHVIRCRSCVSLLSRVSLIWCRSFQLSRSAGAAAKAGKDVAFFKVTLRGRKEVKRGPWPVERSGVQGSSSLPPLPGARRRGLTGFHFQCSSRNRTSSQVTLPELRVSNCSNSTSQGLGQRTRRQRSKNSSRESRRVGSPVASWKAFCKPPFRLHLRRKVARALKTSGSTSRKEIKRWSSLQRAAQRVDVLPE
mmetsp:Transcript_4429/g.13807  ORF Transcript_4429/g.13807 Transcript_4429/m.13807 type:complete len:222 (+) Transcript_4429:132-797(+)